MSDASPALAATQEALGAFLATLTGVDAPFSISAPVEQPTHQSLLDTAPNMLMLRASGPQLTVALWLDPAWLGLFSQAMLGEAMGPTDPGADDLLREVGAQAYGQIRTALAPLRFNLPELTISVVEDPRSMALPDTTQVARVSLPYNGAALDALVLLDAALTLPTGAAARMAEREAAETPRRAPERSARPTGPAVDVAPAAFPELNMGGDSADVDNFDLLVDVELEIVVELGRRRLPLSDVLRLTTGSVIELEKLMGEPLQIFANGKLIAEGEAVVIDEQFGVRITGLASRRKREKVFL